MTKKKKSPGKVHKWMMKNSIIYKSGRKFFKSTSGKITLLVILFILFLGGSFHLANILGVRNTVRSFSGSMMEGDIGQVRKWVDDSADNPYRRTFPDFSSLIEEKTYYDIDVEKVRFSRRYSWAEADVDVRTLQNRQAVEHFQGTLLLQKGKGLFSWKIAGMETR